MWTEWGKQFNKNYFIRDRDYWNEFWENCPYTKKQIYLALRNIFDACKNNYYEARYVSPDPSKFIQGGMLERGLHGVMEEWYDANHPDWENPESEYYDKNLRLFND